jgi:hypothetical protein
MFMLLSSKNGFSLRREKYRTLFSVIFITLVIKMRNFFLLRDHSSGIYTNTPATQGSTTPLKWTAICVDTVLALRQKIKKFIGTARIIETYYSTKSDGSEFLSN